MKSVDIIDKYKNSIMNNSDYSEILSYAYYRGRCDEHDIAKDLQLNTNTVFRLVQELFRDGFIKKVDNYLKCTKKTISLLEEFGFGNLTSNILLSNTVESKIDYAFLRAYCDSDLNRNKTMPTTISLRNMKKAIQLMHGQVDDPTKQEIVWAIIIGTDELLHSTSEEIFVQKVVDFHRKNNTEFWKENFDVINNNIEHYVFTADFSKKIFRKNNELIADYKQERDKYYDILFTTRLLNCLEDDIIDSDLKYIWHIDTNTINTSIHKLIDNKTSDLWSDYKKTLKGYTETTRNFHYSINYLSKNTISKQDDTKSSIILLVEQVIVLVKTLLNLYH